MLESPVMKAFSSLCLVFLATTAVAQVQLERAGDRVDVTIDGKPFTAFYFGAGAPKPYLHPLRSASGKVVTRGFPMVKDIPGESHDHPHHRGVWFAHGEVNGVDFWSEGKDKGHIVLKSLEPVKSGKDSGSLQARFEWRTAEGKQFLEEERIMTFRGDSQLRIVDFEITLRPAGREPVKMGDTKEGTFAVRVVKALEEKSRKCSACTGVMLSSEGTRGEKGIWGKRANWVDYSGTVEGEALGMAIFDHPKNPKHPTYWHARAYGLFAANPFGEHDFYNDKTRDGSMSIAPGQSLTFRYRLLVHPGDAASAKIADLYRQWVK